MKRAGKGTKILNNSFNRSDIDFVSDKLDISIHSDYVGRVTEYKDAFHQYRTNEIFDQVHELYLKSYWNTHYGQKIPNNELTELFYYFSDNLKNEGMSVVELFTMIADYLDLNYRAFYLALTTATKEKILEELDLDYGCLDDIKTFQLF